MSNPDDKKIDKDLQVSGKMEFIINFIEQPDGSISYTVQSSNDTESTMVQYAMVGQILGQILEENTAKKGKKMKATIVREYAQAKNLCNRLAGILADKVYKAGMNRPDVRLTQVVPTDDVVN